MLKQSQVNTSIQKSRERKRQLYEKDFTKKDHGRKTEIKFPDDCIVGEEVDLNIQSLNLDFSDPERGEKALTIVDVAITAPSFKTQKQSEQLKFFAGENSNEISFTLTPIEKGEQVIEVEFFLEASRVGYVIIQSEVR